MKLIVCKNNVDFFKYCNQISNRFLRRHCWKLQAFNFQLKIRWWMGNTGFTASYSWNGYVSRCTCHGNRYCKTGTVQGGLEHNGSTQVIHASIVPLKAVGRYQHECYRNIKCSVNYRFYFFLFFFFTAYYNTFRYLEDNTTIDFGYSYMMGWVAAGVDLFSVLFYLFAAFSLAQHTRRIQEMTSLMGQSGKNQMGNAYTTYNTRNPTLGILYGHNAYNTQSIYRTKKNDADEFFVAEAGRNQAYALAEDFNKIINEDRPGEDEEINQRIKPVPKLDEEPESWYKERKNDRGNDRKYNDRRPPSRYDDRYRKRQSERYDDRSRDYREDRISHPYGYGHHQRGRYRDFY